MDVYVGALILPTSGDCNLNCAYCYRANKRGNGDSKRMSYEVLERFISQYIELNPVNPSFGWQGGEPLLMNIDFYEKAMELQRKYKKPGTKISNNIQTNGTLIDERWAKFFKENNFLVGISIDGPPEYHDVVRVDQGGNPTLKRVLKGREYLEKNRVDYNVLLVINKYNVKHAVKVFNFLIKNGFYYIQLIPCTDFDAVTQNLTEYSIKPEDYARFMCDIFDQWVSYDNPEIYVNIIDILLHSYFGLQPPYCVFDQTCDKMITVDFNGDVYPCDFFVEEQWKLGNIMEEDLGHMLNSEVFKEFRQKMFQLSEECKQCEWFFTCHGGCIRHQDIFHKGENRNYLCEAYKVIFEHYFKGFDSIRYGKRNSRLKKFLESINNIFL